MMCTNQGEEGGGGGRRGREEGEGEGKDSVVFLTSVYSGSGSSNISGLIWRTLQKPCWTLHVLSHQK